MSLAYRAKCLSLVRNFFSERNVMEVDTNVLSPFAPIDLHIDVMKVEMGHGKIGYLHTSPEYAMKKLLAKGSGDIYQLSHVFRAGEEGPLHTPEFTMIEWYRIAMNFNHFIDETLDLIRLFVGNLPKKVLPYRDALLRYAEVDMDSSLTKAEEVEPASANWDTDAKLDLIFTHLVEPQLGQDALSVITDYPASQAALAKKSIVDGREVARRFEIYYRGVELANGYDELTDAKEQRHRLIDENKARAFAGKESLPIDEEFLKALESGLPDCCGVAVGFDRVINLASNHAQLENAFRH